MTKAEETTLKRFETRLRQLILSYKQLQDEHLQLLLEMEEKDKSIKERDEKIKQLGDDFARLKLAQMVKISNEDLEAAKARVDNMVRKVDKCLHLLGV